MNSIRGYYILFRRLLDCGYYSRAATIMRVATISLSTYADAASRTHRISAHRLLNIPYVAYQTASFTASIKHLQYTQVEPARLSSCFIRASLLCT